MQSCCLCDPIVLLFLDCWITNNGALVLIAFFLLFFLVLYLLYHCYYINIYIILFSKSETNAVQPPVLVAATLNVQDMLNSIAFFRKVVGSNKMADVASFAKMEIRGEGDRIITQGEPLESCWILLAGKASMSVWEDQLTDFKGESSMSILENCLDQPLEAFRTERVHMFKKLTETDVSFRPINEPKLRTEIACKIATFPETKLSTKYAFDSKRFRIRSRTISNFPQKDLYEIKEEKRKAKKKSRFGNAFLQHDESKVGAPEIVARMTRRFGKLPKISPILPQDDEMTRWFKMGMYQNIGMHQGVKAVQTASEKDTSNVPLYPGSHFGSVELCGLTAKVSKFTVDVTEDSVWLRIHKKSFVKFLSYEKDIKFRFYQFMNLRDASVRREFQYNLWKDVEQGGSVAGDAVCYAPKISSLRQLKYGKGVEMD